MITFFPLKSARWLHFFYLKSTRWLHFSTYNLRDDYIFLPKIYERIIVFTLKSTRWLHCKSKISKHKFWTSEVKLGFINLDFLHLERWNYLILSRWEEFFFQPPPPPLSQKPQNLHYKIITNLFSELQGQHQKGGFENALPILAIYKRQK